MINATKYDIWLIDNFGVKICVETTTNARLVGNELIGTAEGRCPVKSLRQNTIGLPDKVDGQLIIVTKMMYLALASRDDLAYVTGRYRDDKGRMCARGLVVRPSYITTHATSYTTASA